jgi:uncharacterized coiled-coil protein SlyX
MSARVEKANRIVGVQRQLQRIETWKLAELQNRLAELEASQAELIRALNDDEALHGLFIDTMAGRLRLLAEESARVTVERDAQSRRTAEQSGQLKLAERRSAGIEQQEARVAAQQELMETIEHFLRRTSARLP